MPILPKLLGKFSLSVPLFFFLVFFLLSDKLSYFDIATGECGLIVDKSPSFLFSFLMLSDLLSTVLSDFSSLLLIDRNFNSLLVPLYLRIFLLVTKA